ncbi:hypothetical protein Trihar35433_3235 [Trichoderma harzianum]|nr:hypothetical protein Trihar35433_3235 [Trichoderma harzianum]
MRSNSLREGAVGSRPRAGSSLSARESASSPTMEQTGPPAESIRKLDQIVQNFHTKIAAVVVSSRMKVKPVHGANGVPKINKWYQIETEEIDEFREELRIWKNCGSLENRPPPMIIEVYLDASTLKESQSLVIIDEDGKRWDVLEQLAASTSSSGSDSLANIRRPTEVILERWRVELKSIVDKPLDDFGPILPTIYKKAIVFFRSLFVATKLLPAWKFASQGNVKNSHPALIPQCRIRMSDPDRSRPDLLKNSIDGRRDATTEYMFGDLEVPVGRLCTSVIYRNDCTFRVDDAESLLSSRFMGVDENFFKPSLPQRHMTEAGSLRDHRRGERALYPRFVRSSRPAQIRARRRHHFRVKRIMGQRLIHCRYQGEGLQQDPRPALEKIEEGPPYLFNHLKLDPYPDLPFPDTLTQNRPHLLLDLVYRPSDNQETDLR